MKIIAIASLLSTFSAVQISAPGENFPKWDAAPMFEMTATLSQKPTQLVQAQRPVLVAVPIVKSQGLADKPKAPAGKPVVVAGKPVAQAGKSAGKPKQVGGGAIEAGSPEPPLTKVYQDVEMSSKCKGGVCHVKECFDGKCKTYEKKQPPKFEFQQPDSHWKTKTAGAADPVAQAKKAEKEGHVDNADAAAAEGHLTIPEKATPAAVGTAGLNAKPIVPQVISQNDNLKAVNAIIKDVANRPPTEANKLLLDGLVDDTMIDMDIYSGKKTKEAADILKNKEFAMVKSSEIEQEMVQTNSVLNNIEKLLSKTKK